MAFISAFLTSGLIMVIFAGLIVGATVIGKKLRDKKDATQ